MELMKMRRIAMTAYPLRFPRTQRIEAKMSP
jgi:hypothetical protein